MSFLPPVLPGLGGAGEAVSKQLGGTLAVSHVQHTAGDTCGEDLQGS